VRNLLSTGDRGSRVVEDCTEPVKAWERELNALVCELYGLAKEEITIVEGQNH
jgi:hypothetical protein